MNKYSHLIAVNNIFWNLIGDGPCAPLDSMYLGDSVST